MIFLIFRKKNTERIWSRTPGARFGTSLPAFVPSPARSPVPEDCNLPYQFFRLFLTDSFMDNMVDKSKLYCARKGGRSEVASSITKDSVLTSVGIMFLTGYLTPAQRTLWWENREDTQHLWVKRAMSRDLFRDVLRYTYFVEPEDLDPGDAFWKVRPLFKEINSTAHNLIEQPEFVSTDEAMVRYFGPHPLKQSIREKPERYGWKVWILATASGQLLACQPYAGAKTLIADQGLGQGPNVVLGLAQQYQLKPGSKVGCDNLFTSFDLLDHMGDRGWGVVGTVRQNRIVGVPIPNKQEANKSMQRGAMKTVYKDNSCVTVWKDSQPVFITSNYAGPEPAGTCQRYGGQEKGYVAVPCPKMVLDYNSIMGGVDLLNQNVKNYRITARLKKWYWSLWTWFLNVQMVQAWRLYQHTMKRRHQQLREKEEEDNKKFEEQLDSQGLSRPAKIPIRKAREEELKIKRREEKKKEDMSLLTFMRECVEMILQEHSDIRSNARIHAREVGARLSGDSRQAVRFDQSRPHFIVKTDVRGVCQHCKARSYYRCDTCSSALHPDCFKAYHVDSLDI